MLTPHFYNQEAKEKEGREAGGGGEGTGTRCAFPRVPH